MKKVCNVGINDYEYNVVINGKMIKSYDVWKHMLLRCYDAKTQLKHPTYENCKVCDEWLYFSNFKKWFDENYRYDLEEQGIKLELDKDLLCDDIKIYSPETCIFLPKNVNMFMANKKSRNSNGSTGITWKDDIKKWRVRIQDFCTHKQIYLGVFVDIEEAKKVYLEAREQQSVKVKEYLKELNYSIDVIKKIK